MPSWKIGHFIAFRDRAFSRLARVDRARRRLLVVDGNARTVEAVVEALAELDEIILSAGNVNDALEIVAEEQVDLLLVDLDLAGDSAWLLETLRQRSGAETPIVVLASALDRPRKLRAARLGADGLIEKPIDGELLSAHVQGLLERQMFRQNLAAAPTTSDIAREQEELTNLLVHDLKNPLAVVHANLEFLRGASLERDADAIDALEDAREGSTRIQHLVDDVLYVSKLDHGTFPVDPQPSPLLPILYQATAPFHRQAERKNVRLVIGELAADFVCRCDPGLLRRVLESLIENLLRSVPRDGRIAITVQDATTLDILIGSNGTPVPVEDRPIIFDKYGPGREKGRIAGNVGLGLYFCKRALEVHGGSIEVTESIDWPVLYVLRLPR